MNSKLEASDVAWHFDFVTGDSARPAPPEVPAQLGERFEILGELGSGGMGVVYRALDRKVGREVALKLLKGGVTERDRDRMRREGSAAAKLNHPGVVRVHAAGEAGGQPYIVCELVEGGRELGEVLPRLPWRERVEVLIGVAEALGVAHAAGIVHRDVKGNNVLVDASGRARILDFGIAIVGGIERLTHPGELVGTPYFMAPERFAGPEITPAVDVWSFGVLLYQALSAQLPFDGQSLPELMAAIHRPPPDLRSLAPEVSPAIARVCRRCLIYDPKQRYATGEEVAAALRSALESDSHSPGLQAALGALILGVALLAGVWTQVQEKRTWRSEADVAALLEREDPLEWRGALDGDAFDPPGLRSVVALALARRAERPLAERLELTLRALADTPSGDTAALAARLLAEDDQGAEAGRHLLQAHTLGASRGVALDALEVCVQGGESVSADVLRVLLTGTDLWPPRQWLQTALSALVSAGHVEHARALLDGHGRLLDHESLALSRAALARAEGADPRPDLERAQTRSSTSERIPLELALAYFEAGDPSSARLVLEQHSGQTLARKLSQVDKRPGPQAPLRWRQALAANQILVARRELALLRRPSALPVSERQSRVRAALSCLRSLGLAHETLGGALSGTAPPPARRGLPRWAAVLQAESLLRAQRGDEALVDAARLPPALGARVLLAAGRGAEALGALEAAAAALLPQRADVAACVSALALLAPDRAPAMRQRLAALDDVGGRGGAQARSLYGRYLVLHQQGGLTFAEEEALLLAVLATAPRHLGAQHYLGRARFGGGDVEGLVHILRVAALAPRHLTSPVRTVQRAASVKGFVRFRTEVQTSDAGVAAFLAVMALEGTGRGQPAALVHRLDGLLDRDPGDQAARLVRAFAALRAGRLGLCAADLECVLEDDPLCGQALFYRALLRGAEGDPQALLTDYGAALEHEFYLWNEWRPTAYPELKPYLELPEFEVFRGRGR